MRFHWFAAGSSEVGRELAAVQDVVVWVGAGDAGVGWTGTEVRRFAETNDCFFAINDGVPVFDLLGGGADHAWVAELARRCPGVVLVGATRWHQLASHLHSAPASYLRVVHDEHGPAGLDAAVAGWRGDVALDELDHRFPLAAWAAAGALALVRPTDEAVAGAVPGVAAFDLPASPGALVDLLVRIASDVAELRVRAAANVLADVVAAKVGAWVASRTATEAAFDRAAVALDTALGVTATSRSQRAATTASVNRSPSTDQS
jgi:hypothetical protein